MALTNYRGLQVLDTDPTGAGGLAIQNDLKDLVDWNPKSEWEKTTDPTASDDIDGDYYPGSLWLNTSTNKLFICRSNADNAAEWQLLPVLVVGTGDLKLSANLDVNGMQIVSASNGNVVITPNGTGKVSVVKSSPTARFHVEGDPAVNSNVVARFEQSNSASFAIVNIANTATANTDNVAGFELRANTDGAGGQERNAMSFRASFSTKDDATRTSLARFLVSEGGSQVEAMRLNGTNMGIGATSFGSNAKSVLAMKNNTAPSSSPIDMFQMYSADETAGNAAPHFRTESGAVVKLYQQAHIPDPSGGGTQDSDARAAINAILVALENAGLLATS